MSHVPNDFAVYPIRRTSFHESSSPLQINSTLTNATTKHNRAHRNNPPILCIKSISCGGGALFRRFRSIHFSQLQYNSRKKTVPANKHEISMRPIRMFTVCDLEKVNTNNPLQCNLETINFQRSLLILEHFSSATCASS